MSDDALTGLAAAVLLTAGTWHVSRSVFGSEADLLLGAALLAVGVFIFRGEP